MMPTLTKQTCLVVHADPQTRSLLQRLLADGQRELVLCESRAEVDAAVKARTPDLIILGERVNGDSGLSLAAELVSLFPFTPLILMVDRDTPETLKLAMRLGVHDYFSMPVHSHELAEAIERCSKRTDSRQQWMKAEAKKTAALHRKVEELETLTGLGRSVTSSLNPDEVFKAVVSAAVKLTGADEGSLLLLDEASGELYMRAAHNFQEDFVRTFRLPVKDTTISSVILTGKPVLINEKTPQKIKTAYLVHSLIYVPLFLHGRAVGVLAVDNQVENKPLNERDVKLLEALAEFAVIALENARLFFSNMQEKTKLKAVLAGIQDGVLVIGKDGNIVLMNDMVRSALSIPPDGGVGERFLSLVKQKELKELLEQEEGLLDRIELTGMDGRVFDVRLVVIPDVGKCISFHDITHLKKMDRMKSEFVNTVSHDLRSPLTTIIGYVELLQRVGPLNELQQDFIERVLNNAKSITRLVNELLNLGRIEAGFDTQREKVSFYQAVQNAIENLKPKILEKQITLKGNISTNIPDILANPVQMRQVVNNLIENAVKYTPQAGSIGVRLVMEQNQIIFQVADTGIGIPASDLPHIFDKFFRAGNVANDENGTGLGLAIVRSIIESHNGRIWVDSVEGKGSTFTVVLPLES